MAGRGAYAKGVAKREEILRTALEVFAEQGYLKTSIRELAEAANLSQAGLLHYFGSKEELLVEILRRREEVNSRGSDVRGDMTRFLEIIRQNVEVPGLVQLFATMSTAASDPNHPAHDFFVQRYETTRAGMAADIERREQTGELRMTLDAQKLATIMLAVADGLQVQWLLDPSLDMPEHIDYLWRLLHEADPPAAG